MNKIGIGYACCPSVVDRLPVNDGTSPYPKLLRITMPTCEPGPALGTEMPDIRGGVQRALDTGSVGVVRALQRRKVGRQRRTGAVVPSRECCRLGSLPDALSRIKSANEPYERVVRERELTKA
jgi:hypothetical protein